MIRKRYVIECDQGLCPGKVDGIVKGMLKAEARGLGWTVTHSFWGATYTCPKCQAKAVGQGDDTTDRRPKLAS